MRGLQTTTTRCVAGALSYAELGTVVNKSGGEFSFYQSAFADLHKFWGPLPSFIYSWVSIMYVRPAEVAIIILTFSEYSIRPFSLLVTMSPGNEALLKKIVSILALGNYSGVVHNYAGTNLNPFEIATVGRRMAELKANRIKRHEIRI